MIRFTPQQHDELPKDPTKIARAIDPASNIEYVLMQAAAFDQLVGSVGADAAALITPMPKIVLFASESPEGPALCLIRIAARHPGVLRENLRPMA